MDTTGQHWVASLANYNFIIHYCSGKQNVEADVLSRIKWAKSEPPETIENLIIKAIINMGINSHKTFPEANVNDQLTLLTH